MARPALGCGLARVHVYDRDGSTSRGTITSADLTWTLSKNIDGSSLSFTADGLHPAMVSDSTMLEDALAVVELDVGGVWTAVGTPYVLSPGTGDVVATSLEGLAGRLESHPAGVGAAVGLCGEWLVLHSGGIVNRRGPGERYLGWQTESYDDSLDFDPVDEVDPSSFDIFDAKYGEPVGWPTAAEAATWVYRDPSHGDTGGLSLFRFGTFTVSTARKYIIGFSCDEESRVYLDGPGFGGVIMESADQETGYTIKNRWAEVLQPGTYFVAAEMTTVDSAGGDGFDGARMFVATANKKGTAETVVLMSGSGTTVHRQSKTAVRPGFTPDEVVEILRAENDAWGIPSAALLSVVAADTMPAGEERVWPSFTPASQVLSDLELDVAITVNTSYEIVLSANPGTDLSATVGMVEGADPPTATMNVEALGWTSDPVTGTRAVVLTNDGYVEVISTATELVVDARAMYLESGASGSIAKGREYALDAIAQAGIVRRAYQVDAAAVSSRVPFVNYTVCDVISGLTYTKAAQDQQVLSITGSNEATRAAFTVELGEV